MAGFSLKLDGVEAVETKIKTVLSERAQVARATVAAGVSVFNKAIRSESKGTIKREIGKSVKVEGDSASGRVGLMRFPKRGVRYSRTTRSPHGVYLERGTKYIRPQRFIAGAIAASRARAVAAMERAAQRKIEFLLSK